MLTRLSSALSNCFFLTKTPKVGVLKVHFPVQAYKATAIGIIKEYMASTDSAEVAEALKELGQPDLQHVFVKQVSAGCRPSQETPQLARGQCSPTSVSNPTRPHQLKCTLT